MPPREEEGLDHHYRQLDFGEGKQMVKNPSMTVLPSALWYIQPLHGAGTSGKS